MNLFFHKIKKIFRHPSYINWYFKTRFLILKKRLINKLSVYFRSNSSIDSCIVMFHIGRSGSTILADMLNQHPSIVWEGELVRDIPESKRNKIDQRQWLFQHINNEINSNSKYHAYGFEIKFFHIRDLGMDITDFLSSLIGLGFNRIIVLERKNYLRKIVSSVIAHTSDNWHAPGQIKSNKNTILLNPENINIDDKKQSLIEFLREYDRDFTELRQLLNDINHLWLTYEDDVLPNPQLAAERCFKYLNLQNLKVDVRYGRTNPYPLSDLIVNYGQIQDLLENTPYKWMLTDK